MHTEYRNYPELAPSDLTTESLALSQSAHSLALAQASSLSASRTLSAELCHGAYGGQAEARTASSVANLVLYTNQLQVQVAAPSYTSKGDLKSVAISIRYDRFWENPTVSKPCQVPYTDRSREWASEVSTSWACDRTGGKGSFPGGGREWARGQNT